MNVDVDVDVRDGFIRAPSGRGAEGFCARTIQSGGEMNAAAMPMQIITVAMIIGRRADNRNRDGVSASPMGFILGVSDFRCGFERRIRSVSPRVPSASFLFRFR